MRVFFIYIFEVAHLKLEFIYNITTFGTKKENGNVLKGLSLLMPDTRVD